VLHKVKLNFEFKLSHHALCCVVNLSISQFIVSFHSLSGLVFCLLSMAFFTLMEQKVLSANQLRNGPFYVGYLGLLQPVSDFVKLIVKENENSIKDNIRFMFITLPYLNLVLFLFFWVIYPCYHYYFNISRGLIFLIVILGIVRVPILIISWYSNCKYSIIGGLRSVSQIVSYDCVIGFILIGVTFIIKDIDIEFYEIIRISFILLLMSPFFVLWLPCILAESNRSPFDFSEGESELVSGFNTEYSGFCLSGCFIGEYIGILIISLLSGYIYLSKSKLFLGLVCLIVAFFYIWVRGFIPRYRYDKLILVRWKILLPVSIDIYVLLYSF